MLAKVARRHPERVFEYAWAQAANLIAAFASEFAEPPRRSAHLAPFIAWVERER